MTYKIWEISLKKIVYAKKLADFSWTILKFVKKYGKLDYIIDNLL